MYEGYLRLIKVFNNTLEDLLKNPETSVEVRIACYIYRGAFVDLEASFVFKTFSPEMLDATRELLYSYEAYAANTFSHLMFVEKGCPVVGSEQYVNCPKDIIPAMASGLLETIEESMEAMSMCEEFEKEGDEDAQ